LRDDGPRLFDLAFDIGQFVEDLVIARQDFLEARGDGVLIGRMQSLISGRDIAKCRNGIRPRTRLRECGAAHQNCSRSSRQNSCRHCCHSPDPTALFVMLGLVPGIHGMSESPRMPWLPRTSRGMTMAL